MPMPGTANNELGINAFSGPMGEKEPMYGDAEKLKNLTALAPPGTPAAVGAPKRAKRAAARGKRVAVAMPSAAAQTPGMPAPPQDSYQMQLNAFWQQLAADPESSPLVRQYAQQA